MKEIDFVQDHQNDNEINFSYTGNGIKTHHHITCGRSGKKVLNLNITSTSYVTDEFGTVLRQVNEEPDAQSCGAKWIRMMAKALEHFEEKTVDAKEEGA